MWPWEWRDAWKRKKDGYEPLNKTMNIYRIRPEHVKQIAVILVIAAVLLFFGWPRGFRGEVPDVSHIKQTYRSIGSLTFKSRQFYLDKVPIKIISGSMHYFRVVPKVWEDRMKKMKACGLNTIETSVPWNLHEQQPGIFGFGQNLDLAEFLNTAKRVGLHVIIRVGPYIGADVDFGGLPSWLLADPEMDLRSNYEGYKDAVTQYFSNLMPLIVPKQHSQGGPIIAVQLEHQFGSYSDNVFHLRFLKKTVLELGITELLLTSDGWNSNNRLGMAVAAFHNEALPTASFQNFAEGKMILDHIASLSSDFPLLVMDFYTGSTRYWGNQANTASTVTEFSSDLEKMLQLDISVNFYMFHGGTNFGFVAGASPNSGYQPGVTSYDYSGPLTEAGDITPKYKAIRELLLKYDYVTPETVYEIPNDARKTAYGMAKVLGYLSFDSMLSKAEEKKTRILQPMEEMKFGSGRVQSFGYILYRGSVGRCSSLRLSHPPSGRLQVLLNDKKLEVLDQKSNQKRLSTSPQHMFTSDNTLDLLVENMGRVSSCPEGSKDLNTERKGLQGDVMMDSNTVDHWTVYKLDFSTQYINSVKTFERWQPVTRYSKVPAMFRAELSIDQTPTDTFLSLPGWTKGVAFINGHNVGRYWEVGPQKTLYVPSSYLKRGVNLILIFEELKAGDHVTFTHLPDLS